MEFSVDKLPGVRRYFSGELNESQGAIDKVEVKVSFEKPFHLKTAPE